MNCGYPDSPLFYRRLDRRFRRVARGSGVYLFDDEGRRYLDASSGALVAALGHGDAEMAAAVAAQLHEVAYTSGLHFTNAAAEQLAEELAEVLPAPLRYSYFLCSGSEAVEAAVKLARQYWWEHGLPGKWKVISRVPSYHGNTLAALSLSGREHYRRVFGPLLTEFPRIPAPDNYRHPGCPACTGDVLEEAILAEGPETVAAFLAEPIIGSSLAAMAPEPGYYRRIGEICARYQVLFIADEIMSGMGRTGRWFSFEHYGVVPDIITIGKGLSGGYAPLSAVVASEPVVAEIARGSGAFNHAQTWSHMPASCAAGVAALRRIKRDGLVERAAAIEERFFEKLRSLYRFEAIGDIRGRGLMAGIEFVANRVSKRPFPRSERLAERFAEAAFANGLLVWTNVGHLDGDGDLVVIGPPLTISEAEMDELVERFGAAMG